MTEQLHNMAADHAVILLKSYSFDLEGFKAEELVADWQELYKGRWIRSAVVEALYQGRYKAVSVNQLLAFWQRRGEPICHFNHEFEHIICDSFIQTSLTAPINSASNQAPETGAIETLEVETTVTEIQGQVATLGIDLNPSAALPALITDAPSQDPIPLPTAPTSKSKDLSLPTIGAVPLLLLSSSQTAASQSTAASRELSLPLVDSTGAKQADSASDIEKSDLAQTNPAEPPAEIPSPALLPVAELVDASPSEPTLTEDDPRQIPPIHDPIHQFIPVDDSSEFYDKLKAVALASQPDP